MDRLLGDPAKLPHPVCLIGKGISLSEKYLRKIFPKSPKGTVAAGGVMAFVIVLLSGLVPLGILAVCYMVGEWLYVAAASIMCWQILAARCLQKEAEKVHRELDRQDLAAARRQVGMLVGRDTEQLSEAQVIRATVETVAENTSDGVTAPLFWMMLGGPVLGFMYKAVNTMDSMVGYKNDRFIHFGRLPAKLDDLVNWIPARLTGLAMALAAPLVGLDGRNAFRIWKRDRRKHASPNSAQTEAPCAGALHVQLAGDASYFGKVLKKPFIGDDDRPIEAQDITRTCRLMYGSSILLLLLFTALRAVLITLL